MTLLLAVLACREPEQVTLGGRSASLAVTLLNPTRCNPCDPWRGVETLRVRVLAGADVVAEASFPREGDLVLPDLPGFGVVRVELEGLGGGQVRRRSGAARFPAVCVVEGCAGGWPPPAARPGLARPSLHSLSAST